MIKGIIPAFCLAALALPFAPRGPSTRAASYRTTSAPQAVNTCDARAYVTDKDPKGLNVRETPGTGGKVVAVIPLDGDGTIVHMVASDSKGWVRIDSAETVGGDIVFA
jgi:hypothetical protein